MAVIRGRSRCPYCGHFGITACRVLESFWPPVGKLLCDGCGKEWDEVYALVRVQEKKGVSK